jgi:hypothetical protein
MDSDEASELARFRRNLMNASESELRAIVGTTLDEIIDLARAVAPGNYGVEMAAALSAELHRRGQVQRAPMVGTA